jgi:hypothetical protein
LLPEGQEEYQEAMDSLTGNICRPYLDRLVRGPLGERLSSYRLSGQSAWVDSKSDCIPYLEDIDPRLWVPVSAFPLWEADTESKMPLAMLPPPGQPEIDYVRSKVKDFLRKYAPAKLNLPSSLALKKVGTKKFNDGGTARKDSEKPENSYTSGFLYQRFTTKHGSAREVWLPGKHIKDNNSWWFIVIDALLKQVPYSALLKEPEEVYDQVRQHLKMFGKFVPFKKGNPNVSNKLYFDVSGFGIQFPREYLVTALEEICSYYEEDSLLSEMSAIASKIFSEIDVEMPGGVHLQPPRGIGLGYYENLKSLIVMAIIDSCEPISVFGDQAILKRNNESMACVSDLIALGFQFTKNEKFQALGPSFKWVGMHFTPVGAVEPRVVWTDIMGAFSKEFHFERKAALSGIELPKEYDHIWKRVAFQYECAFGAEFDRGSAFNHPAQGGVYPHAVLLEGYSRYWAPMRLKEPSMKWGSDLLKNVPFGTGPSAADARKFQRKRLNAFKKQKLIDSDYYYYLHPLVLDNKKRKPNMTAFARSMPIWADIRSLVLDGTTTGKVVSGLEGEELLAAPYRQRFARDPFYTRATGGYSIATKWRFEHGASEEDTAVAIVCDFAERNEGRYTIRKDWRTSIEDKPVLDHQIHDPNWEYANTVQKKYLLALIQQEIDDESIIPADSSVEFTDEENMNLRSELLGLIGGLSAERSEEVTEELLLPEGDVDDEYVSMFLGDIEPDATPDEPVLGEQDQEWVFDDIAELLGDTTTEPAPVATAFGFIL